MPSLWLEIDGLTFRRLLIDSWRQSQETAPLADVAEDSTGDSTPRSTEAITADPVEGSEPPETPA
jgi:hypothetical protein